MPTKIEWCDETWNPVTGCTPISEACENCYAASMAKRFWGDRMFTDVKFHRDRLYQPFKWKKPRRIFICSMGDLFHPKIHFPEISSVLALTYKNPQHTFMVLTKRPEIMSEYFSYVAQRLAQMSYLEKMAYPWPAPNLWLGVTVENQDRADERRPILLQIPAALRFVSVEPMLGPIDLKGHKLHWVICGAETGPKARRMQPKWAEDLYSQCKAAEIPFFFKKASKGDKLDLPREFPK